MSKAFEVEEVDPSKIRNKSRNIQQWILRDSEEDYAEISKERDGKFYLFVYYWSNARNMRQKPYNSINDALKELRGEVLPPDFVYSE
jgi:hypothetical protein